MSRLVLVALAVLSSVAVFAAACSARANRSEADRPVGATPAPPTAPAESALHAARVDLAQRLKVDPREVRLRRLQHAGWDGCLGVHAEGQACTTIFIGGYIAWFDAKGESYRYHIGGGRFVAASFAKGEILDGAPVPPELRADFGAVLADYAAHDLALRLGVEREEVVTVLIAPVVFPDLCLGFERPAVACAEMLAPGYILVLRRGAEEYRYHASEHGFVATDFERGRRTAEPPEGLVAVQGAMRQDLARRLGIPFERVGVCSFRFVTWRDGCLGVHRTGQFCAQALVDGFLAELVVPGGRLYRYHGANGDFLAATFEEEAGAQLQPPSFPEE